MCGLVAALNMPLPASVVELLRHRGPDDGDLVATSVGSHRVALGHRRLAIVDLSVAGHQPMAGEAGNLLAYNGEVYNHEDLRQTLGPSDWRGHSDTETVLRWLETRGIPGLAALNGIFGLAWLDAGRRQLVLARDPFGVKPLYYAVDAGRLVAASEIAPLLAVWPGPVDPASIPTLLRLRYLPAPYTLYGHIRKLRPGHALVVDLSGPELRWREQPFAAAAPPVPVDPGPGGAAAGYATKLRLAVERQLMADTEVGILLSGGIDSALVASHAAAASPPGMKAFTVGFEGEYAENEIADAKATADALGLEHYTRVITLNDFLGSLREIAGVVEEPLATTSIVPMHYLAGLAAEHVKVVLSGQGADESLGGYARYRGYRLADAVPPAIAAPLRWLARGCGLRNEQLLRGLDTAAASGTPARLLAAWQVFTPDEITALTGLRDSRSDAVVTEALAAWPVGATATPVEQMMRLDLRLGLADDLLLYTDRITMRYSLECRVPYLDHELVRFVEALPLACKLDARQGKRVHREAATRVLPPAIVSRPKKGFQVPTSRWFRDTARLRRVFAEEGAALSRFIEPAGVERLLGEHAAGFNREKQIFLLLTLAYAVGR